MPSDDRWEPLGPDLEAVFAAEPDPLRALSEARIPAILLRRAYPPAQCQGLIRRFIDRGLMRDPEDEETARIDPGTRIDIGSSLGNRGGDKEAFLAHAVGTHTLFETLFTGFDNPVDLIYTTLSALACGKRVMVAREPDGRLYGPAIFRIHYAGHRYRPHIDHVKLREKRVDYAVYRFDHQFAGVLCFQNAVHEGRSPQAILHRCLWTPDVQEAIATDTFPAYAAEHHIEQYCVELEPGDLYFFNTRLIHEVPSVGGTAPRIVLATFIGYSVDDPEVYVWS
jgi:hypothetical protein